LWIGAANAALIEASSGCSPFITHTGGHVHRSYEDAITELAAILLS
jgi:hypothetical protein